MRRLLISIVVSLILVFALIGFVVSCIAVVSYLSLLQPAPCYEGKIYDCREVNWEALKEVSRLMIQRHYLPDIQIYKYPEDDAMVLSLISPENKLHLIFRATVISVQSAPGKVPQPTNSSSLFAQR